MFLPVFSLLSVMPVKASCLLRNVLLWPPDQVSGASVLSLSSGSHFAHQWCANGVVGSVRDGCLVLLI